MEALDVASRVPEAAIPNPMLRLCIIFLPMGGGLGEGIGAGPGFAGGLADLFGPSKTVINHSVFDVFWKKRQGINFII